jgi:hypothetical protein
VSPNYPEKVITFGMTSAELAQGVQWFLAAALQRVAGTGREQYEKRRDNGGVYQAFEEMTPRELLQMAREEVQDLGVYAAMLDIRLARMQRAFEANSTIGDARV